MSRQQTIVNKRLVCRVMGLLAPALLCLAGCGAARAQEDFRSTLALDRFEAQYQNPPVALQPVPAHVGPLEFSLGLYSGIDYNDNISLEASGARSDIIFRDGVSVGASLPATDRSNLRLGADIGYLHYLRYSAYDGLVVAPTSALTYDLEFAQGTLTFYDQFNYSREVINQGALSALPSLPFIDNFMGARATWLPGHWLFQAGYSHENLLAQTASFQYLNRSSETFDGRAAWRFGENSQAGLEAGASLTTYQQYVEPNSDNLSVGAFTDWQVTHAIHAQLRAGPNWFLFAAAPGLPASDMLSYYYSAALTHALNDFLSHNVSVQQQTQLGYYQSSAYVKQLTASYGLSYALTARIKLSANLTYESGSQPFRIFIFEFTEHFERYGAGPAISWQCTDHLGVSLGYSYWLRQSDIPGREYTQNSATLRLNYTF